jgi:hypothetical protein
MNFNIDMFFDSFEHSESTDVTFEEREIFLFPPQHEYDFERKLISEEPSPNFEELPVSYHLRSRGKSDLLVKKPLQKEAISLRKDVGAIQQTSGDHEHSTKNIVKNYGNAIIGFGISKASYDYVK